MASKSRKYSAPVAHEPRPAAILIEQVLRRAGAQAAVREHRLAAAWVDIVGPRVATRAWPDGLSGGVLWVRVANSSWMHELSFLRDLIVSRANEAVGTPPLVRDVRFHLGRRTGLVDKDDILAALALRAERKPVRSAARTPGDLPVELKARIEAETARVDDPDLREALRQLRRKLGV